MERKTFLRTAISDLDSGESSEARTLDSMLFLAVYCQEAQDTVVPVLKRQLLSGKTTMIKREAAFDLMVLMASPEAMAAVEDALSSLDEETREEVEFVRGFPGSKFLQSNRASSRARRKASARFDDRYQKVMHATSKRAQVLCSLLLQNELRDCKLRRSLRPEADISVGCIGYRIDIVPNREDSAPISIWLGATKAIRCTIGPRSASFTKSYATPFGRSRATYFARSTVESVSQGELRELISPDRSESLVEVGDSSAGGVREFKSSSVVPDLKDLKDDWSPKSYQPYRGQG